MIAGCRGGVAGVWDAGSGRKLMAFEGHTNHVTAVGISADGIRVLTAGLDRTARIWDSTTGKELLRIKAARALPFPARRSLK